MGAILVLGSAGSSIANPYTRWLAVTASPSEKGFTRSVDGLAFDQNKTRRLSDC
jgi:hypothetical protein